MSYEDWKNETGGFDAWQQDSNAGFEAWKQEFDPEGSGYDYASAKKFGMTPDETGHWSSREPTTGLLLKGKGHETWSKTVAGEKEAGYEIFKGDDGRYYSQPIDRTKFGPDFSPRATAEKALKRIWGRSTGEVAPGEGTTIERMEGAAIRGLGNIGRGISYAPLHAAKEVERISKTTVPGPSYIPATTGYDPKKSTPASKAMLSVRNWYEDFLKKEDTKLEEVYERHPEWETDPPENFLDLLTSPDKLAAAVVETTPLLVAAGLATAAGMPQVGYALIFTAEGQEAYDTAIQDGQSEEVARQAYGIYGSVATVIEGMQLKGLIKIGKGAHQAVLRRAVGKLGTVKRMTPKLIKEAVKQSIEEQAQGAWGEATAYLLYGKKPIGGLRGFIDRRAQEGLIAATMAGSVGVLGGSTGEVKRMSEKEKVIVERAVDVRDTIMADPQTTPEQKVALLNTLAEVTKEALGEDIDAATPEQQEDAAKDKVVSQEALLEESNRQQQEVYEELLELAQEGDEVAAQKIQELTMGGPLTPEQTTRYEKLLEKVNEGDEQAAQEIQDMATPEMIAEQNLPTYEVVFAAMLEGDENARAAIRDGGYKEAKKAIDQLEPPIIEIDRERVDSILGDNPIGPSTDEVIEHFTIGSEAKGTAKPGSDLDIAVVINPKIDPDTGEDLTALKFTEMFHRQYAAEKEVPTTEDTGRKIDIQFFYPGDAELIKLKPEKIDLADRGNTPVNASIKATEKQQRKTAIGQAHVAARLLNINEKERYKIQKRLTGIESMGKMNLEDSKKVRDYFQAELKKRGMSVSTGLELADAIKNNTTQKQVKEVSGISDPAWKRILSNPRKETSRFIEQMTRIERMLEAMDGYTEGPIYNSIWKVVHLQLVNSRVSKSRRIRAFREALVDIMTPELSTPEGIEAASEIIQKEQTKEGKKAKKLGRKALRKLVGDSLWAKHVTSGRTVILEATDADPELKLNASERIGVYLAMKNENSRVHLLKGNFAAFTNPDLAMIAVLDVLSSQEKEIAEWILTDLEANFSRANQAAILGLNRELEQRDNYFPMRVIDVADMKKDDFLTMLESHPKVDISLKEPGEVKEVVKGAEQPIKLDSFEVYLNHISRIEQFIHMAPVAKSVGNILRTKEFRQAVSNVTSGFGPNILDRWLKNCIRGHAIDKVDGFASRTLLWLRMKGMMHVLVGNIPSVARQFLSGFNGVASHPVLLAYATTNLIEINNPKTYKLLQQRMIDKSDTMRTRSFERELATVRYYAQVSRVLMGKKEFSEIALSWQKWADKRTVTVVWNSAYDAALNNESVQKTFELDGSEQAAVYFADKLAMRTQPMGDVEHLPDFFVDGPIERLLSTFMNQPNNNLNFWAHDIIGMRRAGKIDNKMVAYRALMSSILPAMMFGAISRGGLPDDWKDAAFDMTVYTLGSVFLVGRMVVDAMLGFAGGKTAVEDIIPANFGKAMQAGIKAAGAEGSEERKKHLKKVGLYTAKTAGALTGLLPNQAIRSTMGAHALMTGETDDLRRLIYSDWSLTQYGWPESAEEKARKKEEESWMKR